MPKIVNTATGAVETVPADTAQRLVGGGEWEYDAGQSLTVATEGGAYSVPASEVADVSLPVESAEQQRERESESRIDRVYGTGIETAKNIAENFAGGATLGGSTALLRAIYGDEYAKAASRRRQARPVTATVSELGGAASGMLVGSGAGSLARALPAARADALAAGVGRALGGGMAGTAARFGAEGAIYGAGAGIHEVAQSTDPVTLERALSTVGSSALLGGVTGAGIGAAGSALAKGIGRAGKAIENARAGRAASGGDLAAEIATYNDSGKEAYLLAQGENSGILGGSRAKLKNILEKSDSIEGKAAARDALVAERKVLEDIASNPQQHLDELRYKDDLIVTRMEQKAEKAKLKRDVIDGRIAQKEEQLARAREKGKTTKIQKYEADLELLKAKRDDIRVKLDDKSWTDTKYKIDLGNELRDFRGGGRKPVDASLDTVEEWIQGLKQDALGPRRQAAISQLPDLIEQNKALANAVVPPRTLAGDIASNLKQTAQSGAAQMAVGAIAGGPIGVFAAAAARPIVNRVGEMLAGRIGKAASDVAERTTAALSSALSASASTAAKAAPRASKVLSRASFSPEVKAPPRQYGRLSGKAGALLATYNQRSDELLSQVQAGEGGRPKMKMSSRRQVARRLDGVRAVDPILADRLETLAARRVEFLASKLPKRPDVAGSMWRPSDMQIRTFARYVAATEDPAGVVERTAAGTVTPEDAEALREVYPEQFADIQRQIIEKLPELRDKLPSKKRIALSILTGVPVDPALDPRVLAQLQSSYRFEPGSAGGTQAPTPQPQFGSVKAPEPTASQKRSANERI